MATRGVAEEYCLISKCDKRMRNCGQKKMQYWSGRESGSPMVDNINLSGMGVNLSTEIIKDTRHEFMERQMVIAGRVVSAWGRTGSTTRVRTKYTEN